MSARYDILWYIGSSEQLTGNNTMSKIVIRIFKSLLKQIVLMKLMWKKQIVIIVQIKVKAHSVAVFTSKYKADGQMSSKLYFCLLIRLCLF